MRKSHPRPRMAIGRGKEESKEIKVEEQREQIKNPHTRNMKL
jgi:hypothetical protein